MKILEAGSSGAPRLPCDDFFVAFLVWMHYTYIIESISTAKWYYGSTVDLPERLMYHNSGWDRPTKGRAPGSTFLSERFTTHNKPENLSFI